jgi:hypothetical protein
VRNAHHILVGKPKWERALGRPKHRGKVNIKLNLREIPHSNMDLIRLSESRNQWHSLLKSVMNLRVALKKFLE